MRGRWITKGNCRLISADSGEEALAPQVRAASTSTIIDLELVERQNSCKSRRVSVGPSSASHFSHSRRLHPSVRLVQVRDVPDERRASGLDCIHSPHFLVTGDLSRCIPLCSSASQQGGRDAPLIGTPSCAMSVGKGSQFGTPCFARYSSLCSSTFSVAMMRCPLNFA